MFSGAEVAWDTETLVDAFRAGEFVRLRKYSATLTEK
jgi:hypothetical protein